MYSFLSNERGRGNLSGFGEVKLEKTSGRKEARDSPFLPFPSLHS